MNRNIIRSIKNFIERFTSWLDYRRSRILSRFNASTRLRKLRHGNILVLCYGNIYRSPFVEYYLNHIKPDILNLHIKSAGFHNKTGRKSAVDYIEYCKEWGVDLTPHRSGRVSNDLLDWAELIVIMDGHNYKMLTMQGTDVARKVIWLGSLSGKTPVEIVDPYGQTLEKQHHIVKQLATASEALIARVGSILA